MAYTAQTRTKRHLAHAARDTVIIDAESSDAAGITAPLPLEAFPSIELTTPVLHRAGAKSRTSEARDASTLIENEANKRRDSYMSRMGLVIYLVALVLYGARIAVGYLPTVYPWVPWLTLSLALLGGAFVWSLRNHKLRTPVFVVLTFCGAGIITFELLYYGLDNTFSDLYLLTLIVPMVFFSQRLSLLTVIGVSALSIVPYIWGPIYSETALVSHIFIRVPCYFVATLLVNRTVMSALTQWREVNKHRRLARDLTALQELTTYIASTQSAQAICDTVVDHLHRSFGYRYASIHLLRAEELERRAETRVPTSDVDGKSARPPFLKMIAQHGYEHCLAELPLGKGILSRVVEIGKPLIIEDASDERDFIYAAPSIRCEVCVPILKRGGNPDGDNEVLGVINLEDTEPGALDEDDLNLMVAVAGALSVALENVALMQEWQERGARLELVNEVAHAVAAKLDLAGVLRAARERLQSLVPVDRATLSLVTEDGENMEIAAVEGIAAANLSQKGSIIPMVNFQPAEVLDGRWLVLSELPPDSPYPFVQGLYAAGIRSHLSIPLLAGDKVVGLFALSALEPNAYRGEHIPLLESIAPHLATAVQNAQLYRSIKQRAETDNLTRLLNLPTFYVRLKEYLAEAQTTGRPLSVVMLDLDLFKSYNDSFGHVAGDSVLRQVASLIRRCLRPEDVAARYGGDEFALIIPGLRAEEALDRMADVCKSIGHTPFMPEEDSEDETSDAHVRGVAILSASAGIASFPDNGGDPEQLVHMADTALYEAKRRGRNRACSYSDNGNSLMQTTSNLQPSRHKRFRSITDTDPELDAYDERELRTASNEYLQAIYAMASAIELRDGYTHGHAERIAFYAIRLGEAAGLEAAELAALRIAGLLHDIGKISLPYEIVHKPGKLTNKEWELVRQHPVQGESIVRPLRNFATVWPMIATHHENYDGTGYPNSLAKADIPIGGRMLRIADAYEVMTVSGRSYHKAAKSPMEAVAELKLCAGTMFDPDLVELFITAVVGDPRKTLFYNPKTMVLSEEMVKT